MFLNENGMILTNQVIVSEQFSKYLVTAAQNPVDDIWETASKYQDYLKNTDEHSMFLKEVEPVVIPQNDSDSEASFHLFAANTSLSFADKNIRRLEAKVDTSLENITNWLKANKLVSNFKSSK